MPPKLLSTLLPLIALLSLACLQSGCLSTQEKFFRLPFMRPTPAPATPPKATEPRLPATPKRVWLNENVPGSPSIAINISEQRAFFLKGKQVIGETDISSGRDGYDTPPGHYSVIQKDRDHRSTLYGEFVNSSGAVVRENADMTKMTPPPGTHFLGAKMPFFLRFESGYGLHAGMLPGHRASHGCVRLPLNMAEHFFNAATVGTPVLVRP